jgi:uncharacterized membrane protein
MITPPELLGVIFAICAALMIAATGLLIRIGTNSGTAYDALVIVLVSNLVVLTPVTVVHHYPEYGQTGRSVLAFVLAGLVGTMLGKSYSGKPYALPHADPRVVHALDRPRRDTLRDRSGFMEMRICVDNSAVWCVSFSTVRHIIFFGD